MKIFVKIMCLSLSMLLFLSLAIACDNDENVEPITTKEVTTPVVTTTAQETVTTTELTTTDDGFGPLIPLVTDKN